MPCHGCSTQFGFWKTENGCPSCGFAFCSSCLKNKCAVPKLNKVCKVCKQCFQSLSSTDTESTKKLGMPYCGPPDAFLKRLEELDGPPKPPVTIYQAEPRMRKLIEGMNSADLEIARRLEKLREERRVAKNIPTDDEIARRLAALRDQDTVQPHSSAHVGPDTRSAEEQTRDLISQFQEEAEIDAKRPSPDDAIAKRLNRLRNHVDSSSEELKQATSDNTSSISLDEISQLLAQCKMEAAQSGNQPDFATIVSLEKLRVRLTHKGEKMDESSDSDEDESKAAAKILAKVQAEVDLEKASQSILDGDDKSSENDVMDVEDDPVDELPWCIICNEDARIRCLGCDRDLYCKSCFKEGHKDEDMKSHVFENFKNK